MTSSSPPPPHRQSTSNNKVIAHAIPTLQFPTTLIRRGRATGVTTSQSQRRPPLPYDSQTIQDLINILPHAAGSLIGGGGTGGGWIGVSSAYLNPTDGFINVLRSFSSGFNAGEICFLTAGGVSHGFAKKDAPKKTPDDGHNGGADEFGRGWIPKAYYLIAQSLATTMQNASVMLYEREGWTFHAKGLWISGRRCIEEEDDDDDDLESNKSLPHLKLHGGGDGSHLAAIVVGSGNYNSRSENLDLESNCIIVLKRGDDDDGGLDQAIDEVRRDWVEDWNGLCGEHASRGFGEVGNGDEKTTLQKVLLKLTRHFL
jgi:hypothetical protein